MAALTLLSVPATSFAQAMTYPGSAPASVRAVEWVRDHGGSALVDRVETWLYSRNPPPTVGPPQDRTSPNPPAAPAAHTTRPTDVVGLAPPLPGEGVWRPVRATRSGQTALWTTWFRPDPAHRPVTVGAALIPQGTDRVSLAPGTREPVPGAVPTRSAQVPVPDRAALVAVFNAGFKMKDSGGGWFLHGRQFLPLRTGYASLAIDRTGRARVGAWGTDVGMSPDLVAVRQNLHLVVRHGTPVPGLATNNRALYGTGKNQFQYTWRSGIGTNAHGDLIYVAGNGLTLATLASAMSHAGILTGMELDIHTAMVGFNFFSTPSAVSTGAGQHLLTRMSVPHDRYLVPDQRDFFYVSTR